MVEYTEFRQEQTDWLVELVMLLSFRLCCSMHDHLHQRTCYYCWLVGDQGDAWRRGYIDLGFKAGRKRTFQIVIEGRIDGIADKHYYKSDMALDDILVNNSGSCSQDQGTLLYQGSLLSDYLFFKEKNSVNVSVLRRNFWSFLFIFFFFKQKTAYEILAWLEFRRVLFRSTMILEPAILL